MQYVHCALHLPETMLANVGVNDVVYDLGFDMGPEWPPEKTVKIGPTPIHLRTILEEHK